MAETETNETTVEVQDDRTQEHEAQEQTEPTQQAEESTAKYTDEDVDNIVKKRLARAEADKQKAVDEAKKLAKMNADQKREYEFEKLQKENERLSNEVAKSEMAKEAQAMFESAELNATAADLDHVVTSEAESTKENVNWLIEHDKRVAESVRKTYTRGMTPKMTGKSTKTLSRAEIMSIKDPVERQKAIADNIQVFR